MRRAERQRNSTLFFFQLAASLLCKYQIKKILSETEGKSVGVTSLNLMLFHFEFIIIFYANLIKRHYCLDYFQSTIYSLFMEYIIL